MFDFRFNTPTPFPESGSRKRFHASGMRGINFSLKITLDHLCPILKEGCKLGPFLNKKFFLKNDLLGVKIG